MNLLIKLSVIGSILLGSTQPGLTQSSSYTEFQQAQTLCNQDGNELRERGTGTSRFITLRPNYGVCIVIVTGQDGIVSAMAISSDSRIKFFIPSGQVSNCVRQIESTGVVACNF